MDEELDIKDILKIFSSHIFVIVFITIFVTFLGAIYTVFLKTPMYQADTTLVLSTNTDSSKDKTITQSDVLLNQNLVSTYSEIIKSRKIIDQVISNLNLDITADKLNNMIVVSSKTGTAMIDINVKNSNPTMAANIANSVADVFSKEVVNIYNIQNVSIIDKAQINNTPYNNNILKNTVIFLGVGFVASLFIVFVIAYFDTTIKSADELEKKLGLPVLSVIPIKEK